MKNCCELESAFTSETSRAVYSLIGEYTRALIDVGVAPEMTLRELHCLNVATLKVMQNGYARSCDIATAAGVPACTVSRYVLSWMQAGWFYETINPDDRRERHLRLTDIGLQNSRVFVDSLHPRLLALKRPK